MCRKEAESHINYLQETYFNFEYTSRLTVKIYKVNCKQNTAKFATLNIDEVYYKGNSIPRKKASISL